jgi:hypothetical protein
MAPASHYGRRSPKQATLYDLVQQNTASFIGHTNAGAGLQRCSASSRTRSAGRRSHVAAAAALRDNSATCDKNLGQP